MYINNTEKLFKDLKSLPTMTDYMVACEEDGQENDISNLISIVDCNRNLLNDGDMNGSCRWDLSECETDKERKQKISDNNTINRIWATIKKELHSKYVIVCGNCKTTVFYSRLPKYEIENYYCYKCKNNHLSMYTLEEWLVGEGIYNDVKRYL